MRIRRATRGSWVSGTAALLLAAGLAAPAPAAAQTRPGEASAARSQENPADSLYRAARAALNAQQWERAATLFGELRARHPASGYAADSYYFQALALHRAGGSEANERALALLEEQAASHPAATSRADAGQLAVRVRADMARGGNSRAAAAVARTAQAAAVVRATRAEGISRASPAQTRDPQEACDDADQDLRATALSALLQMDAARARPILMEVLRARDACSAELRERAVFLVAQKLDAEAVDILLDLAHRNPDPDADVREAAVFWLSNVDTPEAVAALEAILRESSDADVQESAVFALSRHGSARAVEVLKGYAQRADAPTDVREQAIFWLGKNARAGGVGYLRELYPDLEQPDLKEAVIFAVAQAGTDEGRAWLLARAADASEALEVRKNALFWAGRTGGLDVESLRGLYASFDDREMKEQVIFVLAQTESTEAVDALMEIARGETDSELRESAVHWLGRSSDPRVAEFLMELIRGVGP